MRWVFGLWGLVLVLSAVYRATMAPVVRFWPTGDLLTGVGLLALALVVSSNRVRRG